MSTRILLLEDDPELGEAARLSLADAGYEVTWTTSGEAAALLAARHAWDLVLFDVEAAGLSGIGVQHLLRDLGAVPAVAMSALYDGWKRDALEAGAAACLPKPFSVEDLLSLVQAILASRREQAGLSGDVRRLSPQDRAAVAALADDELDRLPFGLIRIDDAGRITGYNAFESTAAGYRTDNVIGMPFTELAPCVMVQQFTEDVTRVKRSPGESPVLRFVFPHHHALCVVSVRLFYDVTHKQLWLFVSKREGEAREAPPGGWREQPFASL